MLPESFRINRPAREKGVLDGLFAHSMSLRLAVSRGRFPPLSVLNDFFRCGHDAVEQGLACFEVDRNGAVITWDPFELTQAEYDHFVEALRSAGIVVQITDTDAETYHDWFNRLF